MHLKRVKSDLTVVRVVHDEVLAGKDQTGRPGELLETVKRRVMLMSRKYRLLCGKCARMNE